MRERHLPLHVHLILCAVLPGLPVRLSIARSSDQSSPHIRDRRNVSNRAFRVVFFFRVKVFGVEFHARIRLK